MKKFKIYSIIIYLVLIVILFEITKINFLFSHTLIELFTILTAGLIFIISTKTYKYSHNRLLLLIGISFLFIAIIDLFHLMTYQGINIIPQNNANIPTQFWIAGGYLLMVTALAAPLYLKSHFSPKTTIIFYTFITISAIVSILWIPVFPVCYIDGKGLTPFKIISEYLIAAMLTVSIFITARYKHRLKENIYTSIVHVLILSILSELCFTLYVGVYDWINFTGHIFRVFAYLLMCHLIVKEGLDEPYDLIFSRLYSLSRHDSMTGLLNRQAFNEYIDKITSSTDKSRSYQLWLMDLDNFKKINDQLGHLTGDQVLNDFADLIRSVLDEADKFFRIGGDEFIIITPLTENTTAMESRLLESVKLWIQSGNYPEGFGLSLGKAVWHADQSQETIDMIIEKADFEMYQQKNLKKHHN